MLLLYLVIPLIYWLLKATQAPTTVTEYVIHWVTLLGHNQSVSKWHFCFNPALQLQPLSPLFPFFPTLCNFHTFWFYYISYLELVGNKNLIDSCKLWYTEIFSQRKFLSRNKFNFVCFLNYQLPLHWLI